MNLEVSVTTIVKNGKKGKCKNNPQFLLVYVIAIMNYMKTTNRAITFSAIHRMVNAIYANRVRGGQWNNYWNPIKAWFPNEYPDIRKNINCGGGKMGESCIKEFFIFYNIPFKKKGAYYISDIPAEESYRILSQGIKSKAPKQIPKDLDDDLIKMIVERRDHYLLKARILNDALELLTEE